MTNTKDHTATIRALNDEFRSYCGMPIFGPKVYGHILITPGIRALPPVAQVEIMALVRGFDAFDPGNDPYGEHDFGAFDHNGRKIFWKIDYYDQSLERGSEDPADPVQTRRVLTIMLAEEY